jgi:tyrosinase
MLEWSVRIRCNEFELGGSFSVLIFVGTVPDDPKQWLTSPSCVGIHDVYAGSAPRDSGSRGDCEVEGYVGLNRGLLEQLGAIELTPDVVVPYLKSELHWRVQSVSYTLMCAKGILPDTWVM